MSDDEKRVVRAEYRLLYYWRPKDKINALASEGFTAETFLETRKRVIREDDTERREWIDSLVA